MNTVFQFVFEHGYSILFLAVFAHQLGVPLPGPLFLLAAGALCASRKLAFSTSIAVAVIACLLADWVWYEAGRCGGDKVLHFIHRLTADPDFHDRRSKKIFAEYGLALLVIAKFLPGLDAVTPPLAGTSRTSRLRFFSFDAIGAGLYTGLYSTLGYVFSHDLNRAAVYVGRAGSVLMGLGVGALIVYFVRKLVPRHRFVNDLRALPQAKIAKKKYIPAVASEISNQLNATQTK